MSPSKWKDPKACIRSFWKKFFICLIILAVLICIFIEWTSRHECLVCGGKGRLTCWMCNGTGQIYSEKPQPGYYTCPECNGAGELVCSACDGKGYWKSDTSMAWVFAGVVIVPSLIGLVLIYQDERALLREKRRLAEEKAQFEKEQIEKGLVKYVNRFGEEEWGTPEQVFEWQQKEKGLVKYEGEWITQDEKERRKKEKFERKFRRKKKRMEAYARTKDVEQLAQEMADYVKRKSTGTLLGKREFSRLLQEFRLANFSSDIGDTQYFWWDWIQPLADKLKEAELLALDKYFESLTQKLIQWARKENLKGITMADVKLFLMKNDIKLSTSFEQILHRKAKLKYAHAAQHGHDYEGVESR